MYTFKNDMKIKETIAGMILAGIYTHEGMPWRTHQRTKRVKEAVKATEELLKEIDDLKSTY